jgi:hypothetical protein
MIVLYDYSASLEILERQKVNVLIMDKNPI